MPISALDYLASPATYPPKPTAALWGDDPFLVRQSLEALKSEVFGPDEDAISYRVFEGNSLKPSAVFDELSTQALFGPDRRMVVVENADKFVSENRPRLEAYVQKPRVKSVLVLLATTWPSNTKLAKSIDASGLSIECKTPPPAKIATWLVRWTQKTHGKKLDKEAAAQMVELVGPELGLLSQELAKLASLAGERGTITPGMVNESVGTWKTRTAWEMLDAACLGDAPAALAHLDRLIRANENPVGLLAQIGSSLRKFAAASRLFVESEQSGQRTTLRNALNEAGVRFGHEKAERQLKHLGRARALALPQWLVQADLDLKGDSPLPPRVVLEKLLVRLATKASG